MFFLYNVAFTSSSFVSFLNFAHVSNGMTNALQLLILNLFKMSWAYFFWCRNTPLLMYFNFILKKYDKFPRSDVSNSYINSALHFMISSSFDHVIRKSSTYIYKRIWLGLFASLTYISCSKVHFLNPSLITKSSILLFQVLGAYVKPYKAFLNMYTFSSCPLI